MNDNIVLPTDNIAKDVNPLPQVSVIIPAGRMVITQHLQSIFTQAYPREKLEVIVVSPHQFDPMPNVRFVKTDQLFYPGEMRNIGAKVAHGDYLLFLDDDCEPLPTWAQENIRLLKNKEIGAVSGRVSSADDSFINKLYDYTNFDLCQTRKACSRVLCSATFGIRKEVFESVDGFDESLRTNEDNDLCIRLMQNGYKTLYTPEIEVVHHHNRTSLFKVIAYMFSNGYQSNLVLARRYPGFCLTSWLFRWIKHPLYYLILLVPLTILNTFSCFKRNFREYPKIIFLLPFIFLSKLNYHIGVLFALIKGKDV